MVTVVFILPALLYACDGLIVHTSLGFLPKKGKKEKAAGEASGEEKTVKETVKKLEKTLTDNKAVITLSKELGQKEFAYVIKKFKSGYYFLYNIESKDDAAVKEFDRVARLDENVVRYLVLNLDK